MKAILFIALGLFIFSCNSTVEDKVDLTKLKEEVMAIHDEVMPKMGELRKTSKELKLAAAADSTKAEWVETANKISNANESMMVWMRNYDPDFKGTKAEVADYLRDQKVKIAQVRDEMNSSLIEGKNLMEADR